MPLLFGMQALLFNQPLRFLSWCSINVIERRLHFLLPLRGRSWDEQAGFGNGALVQTGWVAFVLPQLPYFY